MGGLEVKMPGMGGCVYKCPGSSCVSTQISSTPEDFLHKRIYLKIIFYRSWILVVLVLSLLVSYSCESQNSSNAHSASVEERKRAAQKQFQLFLDKTGAPVGKSQIKDCSFLLP